MKIEKESKNKDKKISGSSLRVLEFLKMLHQGPVEAIDFFKTIEEKTDISFKKEVLWKYVNTLKLFGLNVEKEKNRYYLKNYIEQIDFTETDLRILKFIEDYSKNANLKILENNINEILFKIEGTYSPSVKKLMHEKNIPAYKLKVLKKPLNSNVQIYEKYCKEGLKLDIRYKTNSEMQEQHFRISPVKVIYKRQAAILIAYDCVKREYKEFLLDFITEVKQTPQKSSGNYPSNVIFKLKNRLAKSYLLKEDEKLIEFNADTSVISNNIEDKSMLLRRLIRYYDNCEIVYPKETREQMINFIEDIEKIYE